MRKLHVYLPDPITSTRNDVFIEFRSDLDVGGIGFRLSYGAHEPFGKYWIITVIKYSCCFFDYSSFDGEWIHNIGRSYLDLIEN